MSSHFGGYHLDHVDPNGLLKPCFRLHRYDFIKQCEHSRMASYVIALDEGSAPVEWPQRRDCQVVSPTLIVGDLIGRSNQSAQSTAPYHPLIYWIH
jgi:hypothetical protein